MPIFKQMHFKGRQYGSLIYTRNYDRPQKNRF